MKRRGIQPERIKGNETPEKTENSRGNKAEKLT